MYGSNFSAYQQRLQDIAGKRAQQKQRQRVALKVFFGELVSETAAAWTLMFALPLLGFPQFGFIGLWLFTTGTATAISSAVRGGMYLTTKLYEEPVK